MLERPELVGGACVTEEVWPGQRVSRASYVVSMLHPTAIRDLELARFGYRAIPLDPPFATIGADGQPIFFDQEGPFEEFLARMARMVRPLLLRPSRHSARVRLRWLPSLPEQGRHRTTILDLAGAEHFPDDVVRDMRRFKSRGGSVKVNCILREPPRYERATPEERERLLHTGVALCPSQYSPYREEDWPEGAREAYTPWRDAVPV